MRTRPNYAAGVAAAIWTLVVAIPVYVLVSATFKTRQDYGDGGPLSLPRSFTLQNYLDAFSSGFGRYLLNTVIVTVAVVGIVLLVVPPLAYCIVRGRNRSVTAVFRIFLL